MAMLLAKPSMAMCRASARRSAGAASARPGARPVVARRQRLVVRAEESTSEPATTFDSEKALKDLQAKWDSVENKGQVALYAGGTVVALWISNTVVGAINSVPLVPKLMELVGLTYSAWFTYRYLLFKSSREELLKDIGELSKKISGSE